MGRDAFGPGRVAVPSEASASFRVTGASSDGTGISVTYNPGRAWIDGIALLSGEEITAEATYLPPPFQPPVGPDSIAAGGAGRRGAGSLGGFGQRLSGPRPAGTGAWRCRHHRTGQGIPSPAPAPPGRGRGLQDHRPARRPRRHRAADRHPLPRHNHRRRLPGRCRRRLYRRRAPAVRHRDRRPARRRPALRLVALRRRPRRARPLRSGRRHDHRHRTTRR